MMYVFPLVAFVHASGSTLTGNQAFFLLEFLRSGQFIKNSFLRMSLSRAFKSLLKTISAHFKLMTQFLIDKYFTLAIDD